MFKAPQKPLRSSWKSECFKKPKVKGQIVEKRSLAGNRNTILKYQGQVLGSNGKGQSNQY